MIDANTSQFVATNAISHSGVETRVRHSHETNYIGGEHPTDIQLLGDSHRAVERSQDIVFTIENNPPSDASVSYSLLLTDEGGNELLSGADSPVTTIAAGPSKDFSSNVPPQPGERLYSYQTTAVTNAGDRLSDSGIEPYFAIPIDSIYPLSNEDWHKFLSATAPCPSNTRTHRQEQLPCISLETGRFTLRPSCCD